MADAAIELGGVRLGCTSNGDGTYSLNVTTSSSGTKWRLSLGGVLMTAIDQGDGTAALVVRGA